MMFCSPYEKQLNAAFFWLSSVVEEKDRIFIDIPGKHGVYRFKFPLKVGDYPLRIIPKAREPATFVIVSEEKFPQTEKREDWAPLFASQEFSVYERKARSPKPLLRWGVDVDERRTLLAFARKNLESYFFGGEIKPTKVGQEIDEKFQEHCDLDVALWVRGKLRGSMIATDKPVCDGVAEAALRAARDLRFKPIAKDDMAELRIEISLCRPLKIPITANLLAADKILPEKGYCLRHKGKQGWYFPQVYNAVRFSTLSELLEQLARRKTGLASVHPQIYKQVVIFDVEDFVESARPEADPIVLHASMRNVRVLGITEILERARDGAEWLCNIQEEDGNIPPIVDFTKIAHKESVNWPRLSFAALALHEFGSSVGDARFCAAAQKAFVYLEKILDTYTENFSPDMLFASAYMGQLAIKIGRIPVARKCAERLICHVPNKDFEPILWAQAAVLIGQLTVHLSQSHILVGDHLRDVLRKQFLTQKNGQPTFDFASWASAIDAFWDIDRAFATEIAHWIAHHQSPEGYFPSSVSNPYPYTRGTGKVAEVLALDPLLSNSTGRAFSWLCSMQYNADTTFFVPTESRPLVFGSLRHDYLNWESWTDSVAHYLIAVTRFHKSGRVDALTLLFRPW